MDDGAPHCPGCGRSLERCTGAGACGRQAGPRRFCERCGRRLQEVAVSPGLVEARCRDHGRPPRTD